MVLQCYKLSLKLQRKTQYRFNFVYWNYAGFIIQISVSVNYMFGLLGTIQVCKATQLFMPWSYFVKNRVSCNRELTELQYHINNNVRFYFKSKHMSKTRPRKKVFKCSKWFQSSHLSVVIELFMYPLYVGLTDLVPHSHQCTKRLVVLTNLTMDSVWESLFILIDTEFH